MELWDVYDRNRTFKGKTMIRGNEIRKDDYHLVVHVCIFNSKGEMLIQKRQSFKEGWPGMWDVTVGGSAVAGDDSISAAEREVYEEIGLKLDLREERPFLTVHFDKGFDDIYIIIKDVDINSLKLQYEEVARVKWASGKDILYMIDENTFIPYKKSIIELLFELSHKRGVLE